MGRSVSYHSEAYKVLYILDIELDEYINPVEDLESNLLEIVRERYPSFSTRDKFDGREVHEFAQNSHTIISLSEYMGLISLSISSNTDDYDTEPLAQAWTKKHAEGIAETISKVYNTARRVGGFSDGTSVYERVAA